MNELALFAGAGGGLLATHHLLGWRCVGYVEMADLFGFLELPEIATRSGIPVTAAQLGAEGLTRALPALEFVDTEVKYLTD